MTLTKERKVAMYQNLLKKIFIISTLILLEGTDPILAVWDDLTTEEKKLVAISHATGKHRKHKEEYDRWVKHDLSNVSHRLDELLPNGEGWTKGQQLPFLPKKHNGEIFLYYGEWSEGNPHGCAACTRVMHKLLSKRNRNERVKYLEREFEQSKSLLQEALIELEGLKDDVQRLKAELRIATQQSSTS